MNRKTLSVWALYLGTAVAMAGGAPWPSPRWALVAAGIAVILVGIAVKRRADGGSPSHGPEGFVTPGTVGAASRALPDLVQRTRELVGESPGLDLAVLARRVEALVTEGVEVVAAAQDDFVRRHGFVAYASVMAPLATGERLLNRAWSAASDGHRPEALTSIAEALPYMEEAARALDTLAPTVPSKATASA